MISNRSFHFVVAAVANLAFSGCGSQSDGETVKGTVTFKSHPLANATITFFPLQGRPTIVTADAEGTYSTNILPGSYQVTVILGSNIPPGYEEGDPLPPPAVRLPEHYTIRARTTLSAEVVEDQSEPINFDLK